MSKIYNVLTEIPSALRENATEMMDAILTSEELFNWDRQLRLITDGRTHPNTNMADLVAHLLYPHDEHVEEPKGFQVFIEGLKDIKLESEWVENELVKDVLDNESDGESDSSDDDERDNNEDDDEHDDNKDDNDSDSDTDN